MRYLVLILIFALVFTSLINVSAIEEFDHFIEPEKIELFQKFDRMQLLPPSFKLEHIDELMSKDNCVSLIISIANWGEEIRIKRTSSVFLRGFLRMKRFFSRFSFYSPLKRELSDRCLLYTSPSPRDRG